MTRLRSRKQIHGRESFIIESLFVFAREDLRAAASPCSFLMGLLELVGRGSLLTFQLPLWIFFFLLRMWSRCTDCIYTWLMSQHLPMTAEELFYKLQVRTQYESYIYLCIQPWQQLWDYCECACVGTRMGLYNSALGQTLKSRKTQCNLSLILSKNYQTVFQFYNTDNTKVLLPVAGLYSLQGCSVLTT